MVSQELRFMVEERQFVFDGDALRIYEIQEGEAETQKKPDNIGFDDSRGTYLRSLALNLTNNCNLGCEYCYARQGKYDNPGEVMSFETARNSVDLLINSVHNNNGSKLTIGFFGGEPLLEFDLIEKIVAYDSPPAVTRVENHI
jgi:uncharacterized protein